MVTSFSYFKFMAIYSILQFATMLILYWNASNLGDFQFLYIDLILVLTLTLLMGGTAAKVVLSTQRPHGSLISPAVLSSLLGQIAINVAFQAIILEVSMAQSWFIPVSVDPGSKNIECHENTVVFLASTFQYVAIAFVYSFGGVFREPFFTNPYLTSLFGCLMFLNVYIVLAPDAWTMDILQLKELPVGYRFFLLFMAATNIVACITFEAVFIVNSSVRLVLGRLRGKKQYKNDYKKIGRSILDENWPMFRQDLEHSVKVEE